ncbi:MAG: UDP-N-acetylmuramoyl-tripeptide--D-alanyl-D-alanine ligase [Coprococcus sp.]
MRNMTLENITKACDGQLFYMKECFSDKTAEGVVIDSRQIKPGFIFVAAKGERVDGHRFIPDVFEKGALAVICETLPDTDMGPCILVKDSFMALKRAAAFYRQQLNIQVVGITGSVGKTSTKEFIAAVLAERYKVHKTAGNYNNEVGLPLTIFGIQDSDEIAVLEMGINSFGEMHRLSEVARPDICVMTNIGQCHLENLIDRDGILRAKSEIFDFMNPKGTVVVNGDDDKLSTIREVYGKAPVTFGMNPSNQIWADSIENLGLFGSRAVLHMEQETLIADIPLPGGHMIYNAMAAAAVGRQFGMSAGEIAAGVGHVEAVAGRSHLIKTADKVIIDDCYNANPVSMKAAIDLLAMADTRKVAVLGDMFELGEGELDMHAGVGLYGAEAGIDCMICVGSLSKAMYDAAVKAGGHAYYFETRDTLMENLPGLIQPGDTVLVKASHSMEFEKIVALLQQ